jgi:hypothetical protein
MRAKEFIARLKSVKKPQTRSKEFDEDYSPDNPPGPEFKPTMPKGTVKVDVSDVYDWYKLGQHISNLKGLGKHDFGQGPPSTILSFGDEDTEHKYIQDLEKTGLTTTDIDPVDPNQPKSMKRQKTDPTFNVNENKTGVIIDAHRQGGTLWINYFEVPIKGKGMGAEEYMRFEKSLPKDIKEIRLVASDTGYGKTHQFWDRMGFDYAYPDDDNEMVKVLESSGYIPSNAQKNDPRFKTALSVDIGPDSIKNNAVKLGLGKIKRTGVPRTARSDGKI